MDNGENASEEKNLRISEQEAYNIIIDSESTIEERERAFLEHKIELEKRINNEREKHNNEREKHNNEREKRLKLQESYENLKQEEQTKTNSILNKISNLNITQEFEGEKFSRNFNKNGEQKLNEPPKPKDLRALEKDIIHHDERLKEFYDHFTEILRSYINCFSYITHSGMATNQNSDKLLKLCGILAGFIPEAGQIISSCFAGIQLIKSIKDEKNAEKFNSIFINAWEGYIDNEGLVPYVGRKLTTDKSKIKEIRKIYLGERDKFYEVLSKKEKLVEKFEQIKKSLKNNAYKTPLSQLAYANNKELLYKLYYYQDKDEDLAIDILKKLSKDDDGNELISDNTLELTRKDLYNLYSEQQVASARASAALAISNSNQGAQKEDIKGSESKEKKSNANLSYFSNNQSKSSDYHNSECTSKEIESKSVQQGSEKHSENQRIESNSSTTPTKTSNNNEELSKRHSFQANEQIKEDNIDESKFSHSTHSLSTNYSDNTTSKICCTLLSIRELDYDNPGIDAAIKDGDLESLKAAIGNTASVGSYPDSSEEIIDKLKELLAANNLDPGALEEFLQALPQIEASDDNEMTSASLLEFEGYNLENAHGAARCKESYLIGQNEALEDEI